MNNYGSHTNDEILTRLAKNWINVIAFASDIAHVLQMLDPSPFGNFKSDSSTAFPWNLFRRPLTIFRKMHNISQTFAETNVRSSFRMSGFENNTYFLSCTFFFREDQSREVKLSGNWRILTSLRMIYHRGEEMQHSDGSMNNSEIWPRKKLMKMIKIHQVISLEKTMKSRRIRQTHHRFN
jgi:hypothetical protein